MSPLALNATSFPKVVTVLDSSLASSSTPFAIHAQSSEQTIFLSGSDVATYLRSLETSESKIQEIDFEALKAESASAAPAAKSAAPEKAQKEKDDGKIEGAVQIAIGVKKEVDFPGWYTNVCALKIFLGVNCDSDKGYLKVLIKADMLDYYSVSGCYILKPWSYGIWETIQGI